MVCHGCKKDYTTPDEPCSVMIGRTWVGPCCAEAQMQRAREKAYWAPGEWMITRWREGMNFQDRMLSLR